jgi:hypothetical protein
MYIYVSISILIYIYAAVSIHTVYIYIHGNRNGKLPFDFLQTENGKQKLVFLGRQMINGNAVSATCPTMPIAHLSLEIQPLKQLTGTKCLQNLLTMCQWYCQVC